MKNRICKLVVLIFLMVGCCGNVLGAHSVGYDGERTLGYGSAKTEPLSLSSTDEAALQFFATERFFSVGVHCPSWGNNVGNLTLSLYRWNQNYAKSVSVSPIASRSFVNFKDNAVLRLEFSPREAGRYLWVLSGATEQVGVWKSDEQGADDVRSFLNGESVNGIFQTTLGFESELPFFGTKERYDQAIRGLRSSGSSFSSDAELANDDYGGNPDVEPDTWSAVDGLNRILPCAAKTGRPRKNRQVGIFYWTWHESMGRAVSRPWDTTKILAEYPEALRDIDHPAWGPLMAPHHWGEPLFGYYSSIDRWVLRKHAELLADAGVDVVVFDCTNGAMTWMNSTLALLETWSAARADGVRTPQVAFMLPFSDLNLNQVSMVQLYRDLYRDGRFRELWYCRNGKPLIYANPDALEKGMEKSEGEARIELETILHLFSFRPGQPTYTGGPRRADQWSWLEIYPQNGYGKKCDGSFEMMSVGVAQNYSRKKEAGDSGLAAMNDTNVYGRAFVVGADSESGPDAILQGANFQQQWDRALEVDPEFVFVTGWNEWVAGRHPVWQKLTNAFPDQFNEAFSRDTEPERGLLKDHYYMQLVANIRRYKGSRPQPKAGPPVTIDLARERVAADPWKEVLPIYRDWTGDVGHRDANGYGDSHYTNVTGRNDIVVARVARDEENLYFLVETKNALTAASDPRWMRLFFSVVGRNGPDWESFQYVVNRESPGEKALLERSRGGWAWDPIGEITWRSDGNRLELAIPRAMIELDRRKSFAINFKWSDNTPAEGDILDFYTDGDAAPDGRFTWRYTTGP